MDVLRTPDDRFDDLPDWPYEPRYVTISEGLRVHHVAEGREDGPTVLLTHGEPTWGYLYRKLIPGLVDAGCRVVAPDLVGFGRSDKPTMRDDYTYGRHVRWLTETIDAIGLTDIVLFCQDWGGLLGLVHVARLPERCRAPFVDEAHCAGARQFPLLVPLSAHHPGAPLCREAWAQLAQLQVPLLTAFGAEDDVTGAMQDLLTGGIPGAAGLDHRTFPGAGHFLQEIVPAECVEAILEMVERT